MDPQSKLKALIGQTVTLIEHSQDEVVITTEKAEYRLWHEQDCCENVLVKGVYGLLHEFYDNPITEVEENITSGDHPYGTWTVTNFTLTNAKGVSLFINWYGESNGYSSEGVSFELLSEKGKTIQPPQERTLALILDEKKLAVAASDWATTCCLEQEYFHLGAQLGLSLDTLRENWNN